MRFLADENVLGLLVRMLREHGHDVFWARTDMPAASDDVLLDRAQVEGRIVLTFDLDFGELAFRRRLPSSCGVILMRLRGDPEHVASRALTAINSRTDWLGHFAVVEPGRVRMRPIEREA